MAKMANFMEVDVFVLVACPENTLIDSKVCHYIMSFKHCKSLLYPVANGCILVNICIIFTHRNSTNQ